MSLKRIYNIIVAAGRGSRFGGDLPKQFCELGGRPALMHTIERMRRALPHSVIFLVISESCHELWSELCEKYDFISPKLVYGGDTRWQSVKNAIDILPEDAEIVTIHDGARPIIDSELIHRVIVPMETTEVDGVIPVVPVVDSLRYIEDGGGSIAVDRERFRAVQTPQAFVADRLRRAYSRPFEDYFTDDASVMAAAGFDKITLVSGNLGNIKITHQRDLKIAQMYIDEK